MSVVNVACKVACILLLTLICVAAPALAEDVEKQGRISDIGCAENPDKNAGSADHAGCARGCINNGAEAVLVVGDKFFKLTPQDKVKSFAGELVNVSGHLHGDTIKVGAISKAGS